MSSILRCFELCSGLNINFHKSLATGVGLRAVEEVFKCLIVKLHVQYLGLPFGANPRLVKTWDGLIVKVKSKLASWKSRHLSMGLLTLIKASLASLPIYYLFLFKMPQKVCSEFEMIHRRFLWVVVEAKRGIHCVNWSQVTKPKSVGGLGINPLRLQNEALLAKWWWRFGSEKLSPWRRFVSAKYYVNNSSWLPSSTIISACFPIWRDILSVGIGPCQSSNFLSKFMQIQLGSAQKPPSSLTIGLTIVVEVASHFPTSSAHWNLSFRRPLFVWEAQALLELRSLISSVVLSPSKYDSLRWLPEKNGIFSYHSYKVSTIPRVLPVSQSLIIFGKQLPL